MLVHWKVVFQDGKLDVSNSERLLRDVDSATGTETTELDVDDAVHAGIIETMNRTRSSNEVRDATLLKAHDIATMKRTKRSRLNGSPVRDVARGARRPFYH